MKEKIYKWSDVVNGLLTITKDIDIAIIDFRDENGLSVERTANIIAEKRGNPLKVEISDLLLNGYIDIAKNREDNILEYRGRCTIRKNDGDKAALQVSEATKLTIYSNYKNTEENRNRLDCLFSSDIPYDLNGSAAIGSNKRENSGEIIIGGKGQVRARSLRGAAIGGGEAGAGQNIRIQDEVEIYAISLYGAAIGGGGGDDEGTIIGGEGRNIYITNNARIYANSNWGAGIGGGYRGNGNNIWVQERAEVEADSIGGGLLGDAIDIAIIGIGKVRTKVYGRSIVIANPNVDTLGYPELLNKILVNYNEKPYSNRIVGISTKNSNRTFMTGTDGNGNIKYYSSYLELEFYFTNRYPIYDCKTEIINNINNQQLKFNCKNNDCIFIINNDSMVGNIVIPKSCKNALIDGSNANNSYFGNIIREKGADSDLKIKINNLRLYGTIDISAAVPYVTTEIEFSGYNIINASKRGKASIRVSEGNNLLVKTADENTVLLSYNPGFSDNILDIGAAGIGGNKDENSGNITIVGSGLVSAAGEEGAAGIGGGINGNAGNIKIISDGWIFAVGGNGAEDIGNGYNPPVGTINHRIIIISNDFFAISNPKLSTSTVLYPCNKIYNGMICILVKDNGGELVSEIYVDKTLNIFGDNFKMILQQSKNIRSDIIRINSYKGAPQVIKFDIKRY